MRAVSRPKRTGFFSVKKLKSRLLLRPRIRVEDSTHSSNRQKSRSPQKTAKNFPSQKVSDPMTDLEASSDDYKVVAVGDSGVGKTSIVTRYSTGAFQTPKETIGAAYVKCVVGRPGGPVTLNVWDTAGQERFQSLIPLYLRSAQACIIVFDLTRSNNIQSLNNLYRYINDILGSNVYVVLCGNKCDLEPNCSETEIIEQWADEKNISYFRTSAKSGEGIETLFIDIASKLEERESRVTQIAPVAAPQGESGQCC
jgi:small GTP-binding protein